MNVDRRARDDSARLVADGSAYNSGIDLRPRFSGTDKHQKNGYECECVPLHSTIGLLNLLPMRPPKLNRAPVQHTMRRFVH